MPPFAAGFFALMLGTTAAGTKDLDGSVPGAESMVSTTAGCPTAGAADLWTIPGAGHIPSLATTFPDDLLAWYARARRDLRPRASIRRSPSSPIAPLLTPWNRS